MNFANKVAVVTGGAGGLGSAACRAFAQHGAKVVVVDRDPSGEGVAKSIRDAGEEAFFVQANVADAKDVQGYVDAAVTRYGHIDAFFNNAGLGGVIKHIVDYPEDTFDQVIAVNIKGVFLGLKYVLPVMIKQGSGAIVNMASGSAQIASPGMSAYIASKHAVVGMTKTASGEVGRFGVRVNAVLPTNVDTPMARELTRQFPGVDPQEAQAKYRATIPLGRFPTPEDIADGVLFLCSEHAASISGIKLPIDGGRVATAGSFASVTANRANR